MKKNSLLMATVSIVMLANFGGPPPQDGINFYGTLKTHSQDQAEMVNSISIGDGKKTKQIAMYEKPTKKDATIKMKQNNEIILSVDPKTDLTITYIDLNEVREIRVPKPKETWLYQKKEGYRKSEYLEVSITDNSWIKKTKTYLLDRDTKVYCNGKSESGPKEKKVPLPAIDRLAIEGYSFKQEKNSSTRCVDKSSDKNKSKRHHGG